MAMSNTETVSFIVQVVTQGTHRLLKMAAPGGAPERQALQRGRGARERGHRRGAPRHAGVAHPGSRRVHVQQLRQAARGRQRLALPRTLSRHVSSGKRALCMPDRSSKAQLFGQAERRHPESWCQQGYSVECMTKRRANTSLLTCSNSGP